jgi:hypothetical protein
MTPDFEQILARLSALHPPFWKDYGYLIAQIIALAGGVFSFLAYIEASKAFREAQSAKEAAKEARGLARRRSLMEDLEDVSHKLQQVGIFLQQQEWFAVQLRIDEIAATCRSAMTRWSDHLQEGTRNNVLTSVQLIRSIARQTSDFADREPSLEEIRKLSKAYSNASDRINAALGEARRLEERLGVDNAS